MRDILHNNTPPRPAARRDGWHALDGWHGLLVKPCSRGNTGCVQPMLHPVRRARRGSALLMAVGLLVILAMLGTTFLLICRMDAKQSLAMAEKAPTDPLAGGILQEICTLLRDDLYIDGSAGTHPPYSGIPDTPAGWRQFVDYPSEEIDPWLASNEFATSQVSPTSRQRYLRHISDPGGRFAEGDKTNVTFIANWDSVQRKWLWDALPSGEEPVDLDGDQWADALFYDTEVTNVVGDKYYAAVRIIDLGGLLNVNTAAQNGGGVGITMPTVTSPVHIHLNAFLSAALYTPLHDARCGGTGTLNLNDYYTGCAQRLLEPSGSYLPFAIGDEMHLRWFGRLGVADRSGRLYTATKSGVTPMTLDLRRLLTSFNCSRIIPRHPSGTHRAAVVLHNPNDPGTDLLAVDDGHRRHVYSQMLRMLTETDVDLGPASSDPKRMAAHFLANLWAYISPAGSSEAFEFSPEDTFTVYGLTEPEVVITEAYAKGKNDASGDLEIEVHALELTNVSDHEVDLNDTDNPYFLIEQSDGTSGPSQSFIPLPVVPKLGNGDMESRKHVFYTFIKGSGIGFLDLTGTNATAVANLNLTVSSGKRVILLREVGGTNVPVDSFDVNQLGWAGMGAEPADEVTDKDIRRHDSLDDYRYLVAKAMVSFSNVGHRLGENGNLLTPAQVAGEADFPVRVKLDGPPADLAEIQRLFLTGPYESALGSYRAFTETISDFDDGPARGRLDFHPDSVLAGGWNGGKYPDVPAAAMLSEFFTVLAGDPTREEDEKDPKRLYGKININTATRDVLERLPFQTNITLAGLNPPAITPTDAVSHILAYREMEEFAARNYAFSREGASGITNLRRYKDPTDPTGTPVSEIRGFLTPGEVAVPLADYVTYAIWARYPGDLAQLQKEVGYIYARDTLYRSISNLITVNSDVFAVNMMVQLRAADGSVRQDWYYVAVVDRSNCRQGGHVPAVLLFSQVK